MLATFSPVGRAELGFLSNLRGSDSPWKSDMAGLQEARAAISKKLGAPPKAARKASWGRPRRRPIGSAQAALVGTIVGRPVGR